MISALNLIWLIPLCFLLGGLMFVFIVGSSQGDREYEAYNSGIKEGMKRALGLENDNPPYIKTLREVYDTTFKSDFNKFTEMTGNIIYLCHSSGQLEMLFMNDVDLLSNYFDYYVIDVVKESTYNRLIIEQNQRAQYDL